jgi:hypothetical protein
MRASRSRTHLTGYAQDIAYPALVCTHAFACTALLALMHCVHLSHTSNAMSTQHWLSSRSRLHLRFTLADTVLSLKLPRGSHFFLFLFRLSYATSMRFADDLEISLSLLFNYIHTFLRLSRQHRADRRNPIVTCFFALSLNRKIVIDPIIHQPISAILPRSNGSLTSPFVN